MSIEHIDPFCFSFLKVYFFSIFHNSFIKHLLKLIRSSSAAIILFILGLHINCKFHITELLQFDIGRLISSHQFIDELRQTLVFVLRHHHELVRERYLFLHVFKQNGVKQQFTIIYLMAQNTPQERTDFLTSAKNPRGLFFWPYSIVFSLTSFNVVQSLITYNARLLSYPAYLLQSVLISRVGQFSDQKPNLSCPIQSSLFLTRYRNYQDQIL